MNDNYGTEQLDVDKDELKQGFSEVDEDTDESEEGDPLTEQNDGSFGGEEDSDEAEVFNAIFEYQGYDER